MTASTDAASLRGRGLVGNQCWAWTWAVGDWSTDWWARSGRSPSEDGVGGGVVTRIARVCRWL